MVAVGQKQILARHAPIEKSAMDILIHHLETSRAPLGYERFVGRGYKTILRIVIDEYRLLVAHGIRERYVTVGEQNFLPLLVGQIQSVIGDAGDFQCLDTTYFHHV